MIDNTQTIDLPCPGCGHKTSKSLSWIRENPEAYTCEGCGKTVVLDGAADITASLDSIDDAVADLSDTFDRLSRSTGRRSRESADSRPPALS